MATPNLERQVEARLRDRQIRMTDGRRALVESLAGADGPRSAADIHGEIGERVPLSSIYRSLTVLEDAGVVSPHYSAKGVTRYELSDWLSGHHHHLVCTRCGEVEDIEIDPAKELILEEMVEEIGREESFVPTDHALEIEGLCSRCR